MVVTLFAMLSPAGATPPSSTHLRARTPRGPVHVWTPADYDAATADLVIYVHGYYVTVDEAWRSHQLAAQFEQSHVNAMFVVCGAPSAPGDAVDWESLDELISALVDPPRGRVIALAHSGGHRTIRPWLTGERLDGLVLLDAAYGLFPEIEAWIAGSQDRRLIDVSELTRYWADKLHETVPATIVLDELPAADSQELRDARVVYVRPRIGHMEMVTDGAVIPTLLRWFVR